MAEALTAKNSEIEALLKSVDSLKTQLALSEGNLASLQVQDILSNYNLYQLAVSHSSAKFWQSLRRL